MYRVVNFLEQIVKKNLMYLVLEPIKGKLKKFFLLFYKTQTLKENRTKFYDENMCM